MKRKVQSRIKAGLIAFALVVTQVLMPVQSVYADHNENHNPTPPANNAGDIKIRETSDADDIPQNDPQLDSCSVTVEFYNFNNATDLNSTVSFTSQAPTASSTIKVTGSSLTPVVIGDEDGDGQGSNDLDGSYTYTLEFTGEPDQQGYHVDLDVNIIGTVGGSKQKIFWMPASCRALQTEVTPAVIRIDECGVLNDSVRGVATDGITYTESSTGLNYTVIAQPASDDYKIVVSDSGFVLNDDGSATYTTSLSNIDCEEEKDEIELPSGISDICGPRNDILPMPKEGDYFTVKSDSQWQQDGEDLVKTIRTITYEADSGYVFIASEGWVLSEDRAIATYTFTDWGTKCPSENICTVSDKMYDRVWQYDGEVYPEYAAWPEGVSGTIDFQDEGLYINTPNIESYVFGLFDAGETPMADVDAMGYNVLRQEKSAGVPVTLPAYILSVDTMGNGDEADVKYFFYEPYYNDNARAANEGVFQEWDAYAGGSAKWYMSGTGQKLETWNTFVSQFPDAVVLAHGFNQGTYNAETYSVVQDIVFDCATTSFRYFQGSGGVTPEIPVTPVTPTTPVVDTPQQVKGTVGVLPAELPMTGSGGLISTWLAILAAILTYGAVLYLQPKKRLE